METKPKEPKVRVIRVIIYEGAREWVEEAVTKAIHGSLEAKHGCRIYGKTLNDFPWEIPTDEQEPQP